MKDQPDSNTAEAPVAGTPAVATAPPPPASKLVDFEMLGRFLGLALLQQVTVGVRLHPSICKLLLQNNVPWEWTDDDVIQLDPLLFKHKVQYVRENDVERVWF